MGGKKKEKKRGGGKWGGLEEWECWPPKLSPMTEQWESKETDISVSIRLSNQITVFPHTSLENMLKLHLSASEPHSKHTKVRTPGKLRQVASKHPFKPLLCFLHSDFKFITFFSWCDPQILPQHRKNTAKIEKWQLTQPFPLLFPSLNSLPFWITAPACKAKLLLLLLLLPGHTHRGSHDHHPKAFASHTSHSEKLRVELWGNWELSQNHVGVSKPTWERKNKTKSQLKMQTSALCMCVCV